MAWMARTIFLFSTLFGITCMPFSGQSNWLPIGVANAAPMIELLSGGNVVGDGTTPVTLNVLAYRSNGQPMNGSTLKVSAQAGKVGRVSMSRPGLFTAEWTPPKVDAISDVNLTVKGKSPDGETISKSWVVSVVPSLSHQVSISANPSELTLGRDAGTTLSIQLSGGAQASLEGVDLDVWTNSGTVENVTHLGEGRFAASYPPPGPILSSLGTAHRRGQARPEPNIRVGGPPTDRKSQLSRRRSARQQCARENR